MAFLLFFELPPNKKYSELHLVNPHSSKQMTRSHFNAITTTTAKRYYRPGPNTRSISTTKVSFSTVSVSWIYDLRCSLVTNPLSSAASSELFPEPSREVLQAAVGVDLLVDKPHMDAAKSA